MSPDPKTLITIITFSLLFVGEHLLPFFSYQKPLYKQVGFNLGLGLVNTLLSAITIGIAYTWIFDNPSSVTLIATNWPLLVQFLISFTFLELYIYSWHRANHEIPFLWGFHKLHHTDTTLNSSSAFRFHTIEVLLSQIPRMGLVWLVGIPFQMFVIYEMIFTVQNIIQHSNINLPYKIDTALSSVVITPNLHRLHHSDYVTETNSNYATVLSIWDKLFGTLRKRTSYKTIRFGIQE
jgi:sterol desaturase/sphingolipid hydroxylase (fatty acid hydroxylase superfamily)